ncbi:MAG TPA: hypothetical protein QF753_23110 [Victivallales bacterium]|nr:hypothetical protein [Victivallales bacterium]
MANYRSTEADWAKSGLGGPGGGGMKRKRKAKRRANAIDRENKQHKRHQSKFLTTGFTTDASNETTVTTQGHTVEKHSQTVDDPITKIVDEDGNHIGSKLTEDPKTVDHGTQILEDVDGTTETFGDKKIVGSRTFEAHKLYKNEGGVNPFELRKKASMTKTNAPKETYGHSMDAEGNYTGTVTNDAGRSTTFTKYDRFGVAKREKVFKVKGDSGSRDEGGPGDTRVPFEKEKGVRYKSSEALRKKEERFVNRYNRKAGSANLAQGDGNKSTNVANYQNMTHEEKAAADLERKNTFVNKKQESEERGYTGKKNKVKARKRKKNVNTQMK